MRLIKETGLSIGLVAVSCYVLCIWMLPETMKMEFFGEGLKDVSSMDVFYATIVGLIVGAVISSVTEYYTGLGKAPTLKILFNNQVLELELILSLVLQLE